MKKILSVLLLTIVLFTSTYASDYVLKTPLEAANFLAAEWVITDKSANPTEYRLLDTITRQEVMKIVAKLSGESIPESCSGVFSDVDVNGWGCKYIEWALDKDLIASNATFRPEDNITKTEAMKLVLKVQNISKIEETDNWQNDYMVTALEYGIITEIYYDYNADALRWWIFQITTATIEQEEEIKEMIELKEEKLMSDEAM